MESKKLKELLNALYAILNQLPQKDVIDTITNMENKIASLQNPPVVTPPVVTPPVVTPPVVTPPVVTPPVVTPPSSPVLLSTSFLQSNIRTPLRYSAFPKYPDLGLLDGTTVNNTNALLQTINSVNSGSKIILRGGRYNISNLTLSKSVSLIGHPGENVEFVPQSANRCINIAGNNITLSNIKMLNYGGDNGFGILMNDGINNLALIDITIDGVHEGVCSWTRGTITGLLLYNCKIVNFSLIGLHSGGGKAVNWRIENCKIAGLGSGSGSGADAFATEDCDNVLFANCEVTKAAADGIDTKGVNVAVIGCNVHDITRNGIKLWNGGDIVNTTVFRTGADAQVVVERGNLYITNSIFAYHNYRGPNNYGSSYYMTLGYDERNDPAGGMKEVRIKDSSFAYAYGSIWITPSAMLTLDSNLFYNGVGNGTIINKGNIEITRSGGDSQFNQFGNSKIALDNVRIK